ncbi:hypothetical protein HanXRQr2_Chr13g0589761 [Helianthus annuus]|uniref:Uncharacterized protein n=1 Tax=Helianthus annuus TaxID=4232 RepID=A0A9K3HAZ0_HELAN|nr:hypothetical protein HanXRQr2_Chr13g0589761 [Helianthus annuus]KAJ0849377.1 hypothetical protein HanPSC8_Chr13g0568071 [Helianthus annuus]
MCCCRNLIFKKIKVYQITVVVVTDALPPTLPKSNCIINKHKVSINLRNQHLG